MPPIPLKVQGQAALDAACTLYDLEARQQAPTPIQRQALAAFPGFGLLAKEIFPDPVTAQYPDAAWEALGTRLHQILTPEDYASALSSTYSAFYTPRLIMRALFLGLKHCGVPDDATVLEPGCGIGRFMGVAPASMAFIGVEHERLSGRICRLLYPQHEIRLEPIQRTGLDQGSVDGVVGNIPFSQEKTAYWGRKLSLHELCMAKSMDALRPGGVLALVVTHYVLDRTGELFRRELDSHAQFLGAIRLPSDAFAAEGTKVVTDLLFLAKRAARLEPSPAQPWLETAPVMIEGAEMPINRYFLTHPAQVLGTWSRQDRLYGDSYSVVASGVLANQLAQALTRLPKGVYGVPPPLLRTPRLPLLAPAPQATPEGAFLVTNERLYQWQQGQAVPVCHGDKPILTTGVLGKRVAHLIRLRDQAREVLRIQQVGEPQAVRRVARKQLQDLYLDFLGTYGPINTVVVSEREDGTLVRRMPNLLTFKDDPDAMLVMALEHYDESSGTATLADIFTQDVVGHDQPVTHAESAAEALLVVLNTTGKVDLSAMADLYGQPEAVVLEELGDLLYHDPAGGQWETADVYVSGHVKRKLAQAASAAQQDPAYTRNVTALQAVQPPDLLPSEIEAHLGAPWIPRDVIQQFVCETFLVESWQAKVAHLKEEALWNIEATHWTQESDAARVTYGTSRVSGLTLVQQALNLQMPTIYDPIIRPDGRDGRKVNEGETLAAHDKQQHLKDHFSQWLWQDTARAERMVRLYNDLRNTHRARQFNGDHLTFPGMTPLITLTPAQTAATWRIVTTGNTYLGHAVGAGKTYVMIAAGMKMKQVGLARKPLYVVKNTTLVQFGQMAQRLYPHGRFLLAGPEDFTQERRKLLAAKMASSLWDGIIMPHTSFMHLGLSGGFQEGVLTELIKRYEALLIDHERAYGKDQHNIRKVLEKQKSTYTSRLEELRRVGTKDDGLLFDELGIDALFVDEAHAYRKLETPTKMQRVAGVQGEGSGRAFDLYMKVRYLHGKRPGYGVVFASATPVCNTLGELYGIQRMLTPEALDDSGIGHFDAWAATFATVTETLELGPDGQTLRPRVRLGEFANLPELQQMLVQFMDVQTTAQLALPVPELAGGAMQDRVVPLSPEGRVYQAQLVERYGQVRHGAAQRKGEALLIMSEGRKLGVDARLVMPTAQDHPGSKLHALCDNVYRHWVEGQAERTTQLIFCDVGVNPTAWGFGAYAAVIEGLVALGIPRHEIARMDEANTDMQRHRLFTQVRTGQVRVLIGSTEKMGTGTNVQERLVALHHVDVPLLPNEIDQRNGRLLRQGNLHRDWGKPVHIYAYGTAGSVEATFWQILQTKAHFTHQFLSGATVERKAEDIGEQEVSFATLKAIVSGNPAMRTLAETDAEVRRLALLAKHHQDARFQAQWRQKHLPDDLARQGTYLAALQADQATLAAWQEEGVLVLEGQLAPSADVPLTQSEARRLLDPYLTPYVSKQGMALSLRVGTYKGVRCGLRISAMMGADVWLEGATTRVVPLGRRTHPGVAFLSALRALDTDTPVRVAQAQYHLDELHQQGRTAQAQAEQVFGLADYQRELGRLRTQLEVSLSAAGDASQQEGLARQIETLRAAQTQQAGSPLPRSQAQQVPMAEAVTTTIMRALEAQEVQESQAAAD